MTRNALTLLLFGPAVLLQGAVASGDTLKNPGFEAISDWLFRCGDDDGVPPSYSSGCAASGRNGLRIGRDTTTGESLEGCSQGRVALPLFLCEETGGTFCTLRFKARFTRLDGEEAEFKVVRGNQITTYPIPANSRLEDYAISIRNCGVERWFFVQIIEGDTPGVQSILCLDDLECECTNGIETDLGPGFDPFGQLPVDVLFPGPDPPAAGQDGYFEALDCNGNLRADRDDIAGGVSSDENANGVPDECESLLRGDCDGDGEVEGQVGDAIVLLIYNFAGGEEPACLAACDADGDGLVRGGVGDAIYLLAFNFLGGQPPVPPFPACGLTSRPTDAELGCRLSGCVR